jgi:hypothetical protein
MEQPMLDAKEKAAQASKESSSSTYGKKMARESIISLRALHLSSKDAAFALGSPVAATRRTHSLSRRLNNAAALEIRPELVARDLSDIAGAMREIRKA